MSASYPSTPVHHDFHLVVRQQPKQGRMAIGKEKDRKPLDPPPIVQLCCRREGVKNYLQSPYLILTARLIKAHGKEDSPSSPEDSVAPSSLSHNNNPEPRENDLVGTVVSSLYSLKDTDNTQGGFFVFGDLSVRKEGTYRLEFILYELRLQDKECWQLTRTTSEPFVVYAHKLFPGIEESTFLTRSFSDQGVRLRLRKDSRSITTRKRNSSVANQMDHYRHQQAQAHHAQHQYSSIPEHGTPDLSPGSHSHLRRTGSMPEAGLGGPGHLDRSRASVTPSSSYFSESPQLVRSDYGSLSREYGSGSYNYGYEDGRSSKRMRLDESPTTYDNDYPHYAQAGPRTVPDHLSGASLYPMTTTSYGVAVSQPAAPHLPPMPMPSMMPTPSMANPSPFSTIPRIDTQLHHHSNMSPH
ncbi:Velvet factor domain containing protein [Naviculisporaceae sp. PSN 640]